MKCKHIKNILTDYIDESLPPDITKEVEFHLKQCKSCSEELFILKNCISVISTLSQIPAPKKLLPQIRKKIEQRKKRKKKTFLTVIILFILALISIIPRITSLHTLIFTRNLT